ncbi:ADAM metallopeptidase with thrombospondin type 1 motif 17 [Phyllostomus discolor]|uniref:ADAM metallopeptidase with thrombospondin type 1 motif 17 n=1 Tax=Phyllostomus discolor TaxID=89673 RepID=A0A833YBQ4_9CHIR|nr:ADAM metallopeptidase with thrombospondin type 1 motif 17 [Phyllostomus discolor]
MTRERGAQEVGGQAPPRRLPDCSSEHTGGLQKPQAHLEPECDSTHSSCGVSTPSATLGRPGRTLWSSPGSSPRPWEQEEVRAETDPPRFHFHTAVCTEVLLFFPWALAAACSSPASFLQRRNPTSMSVFPPISPSPD